MVDRAAADRPQTARLGEARTAYEIADGAAPPTTENNRAEQQFTAGWIALEFLHEPALALPHFARVADGVVNPITLGRSYYWQGRAAQMLGREQEARSYYETAARYPTGYYGQLARSKLGSTIYTRMSSLRRRRRGRLNSLARSKFSTPSTSPTWWPVWRLTSATNRPTLRASQASRRLRRITTTPGRPF